MASRVAIPRRLRRNQTDAERELWFRLRDRRLRGLKFRRQAPVDRYVVDFLCADANLIIELDGGQHVERSRQDIERTRALEARGYLVLRLVLSNLNGVVESIVNTLKPLPPHPNPLPNGERERARASGESEALK